MAYCGPRGIPLSVFLGWADDDQAAALEWLAEDRRRCRSCGSAEWEWEEDPEHAEAEAWVCRGCARVENLRQRMQHEDPKGLLHGLHIRLVPREVSDGRRR